MSWLQRLVETYDACMQLQASDRIGLAPVGSVTQRTQLLITIGSDGSFVSAELADEEFTTMFVTEDSAGRSGTDPKANPLTEQLEYCAKGIDRFGGDASKYVRYVDC